MNHNGPGIHSIAHRVLGVAVYLNVRSVEIGAQGISGNSVNGNPAAVHAGGDESLAQAALDPALNAALSDGFVQRLIAKRGCID